jgi:hypothetical protein
MKLRNDSFRADLSDAQDWLFQLCCTELEARSRADSPGQRCVCELCFSPFERFEDLEPF